MQPPINVQSLSLNQRRDHTHWAHFKLGLKCAMCNGRSAHKCKQSEGWLGAVNSQPWGQYGIFPVWSYKYFIKLFSTLCDVSQLGFGSHKKRILKSSVNSHSFPSLLFSPSNALTFWPRTELLSFISCLCVRVTEQECSEQCVRASHLPLPIQCLKL